MSLSFSLRLVAIVLFGLSLLAVAFFALVYKPAELGAEVVNFGRLNFRLCGVVFSTGLLMFAGLVFVASHVVELREACVQRDRKSLL